MRVVGGRWSGRRFEAPEGRGTTRPTTERTREAIASMILSEEGLDLTGSRVLDAFAGSGTAGAAAALARTALSTGRTFSALQHTLNASSVICAPIVEMRNSSWWGLR